MSLNIEKAKLLGMLFLNMYEAEPEAEVDMMESDFYSCTTIACHAGWFAIAREKERVFDDLKNTYTYDFDHSADEMARFLGFSDSLALKNWTVDNPKLWGNGFGRDMFCSWDAFGGRNYEMTLKTIGLHWLKVAGRAEKHDHLVEMSRLSR